MCVASFSATDNRLNQTSGFYIAGSLVVARLGLDNHRYLRHHILHPRECDMPDPVKSAIAIAKRFADTASKGVRTLASCSPHFLRSVNLNCLMFRLVVGRGPGPARGVTSGFVGWKLLLWGPPHKRDSHFVHGHDVFQRTHRCSI